MRRGRGCGGAQGAVGRVAAGDERGDAAPAGAGADYELRELRLLSPGDGEQLTLPVDGSSAGQCFIGQVVVSEPVADGIMVLVPLSLRAERLRVLRVLFDEQPVEPGLLLGLAEVALATSYVLVACGSCSDVVEAARRVEPLSVAVQAAPGDRPARGGDLPGRGLPGGAPAEPGSCRRPCAESLRAGLRRPTVIRIGQGGQTFLSTGTPVTAGELLASYVELSQPATRKQIEQLAAATSCPPDKQGLQALAANPPAYAEQVLDRRVTPLDLLESYPACQLPFSSFLQLLAPLTPRQYSISSSPRWSPDHATVTVAVLQSPALSGRGTCEGAASTYLAHARPGSKIAVSVRPSNVGFRPPQSLAIPLVMACAGSGIAPFRGFLQDRAQQAQEQDTAPAPALLFFGCDHPDVDYLYREELTAWAEQGIVDVRPAYSAAPQDALTFVQDRLWADRADVIDLVRQGAVFYVCGDGRLMAPAVYDTCTRIYRSHRSHRSHRRTSRHLAR